MTYEVLPKVFLIVYEVVLIVCMSIFAIRLQAARTTYKEVKKEYALTSETVKEGHSGKTRADIEKYLVAAKVDLISWLCIFVACIYACFDCFVWIFS